MSKIISRFSRGVSHGLDFSKSTPMVQEQFQRDADVNFLVRRYLGGDMSVFQHGVPLTVDLTTAPESMHDALNRMSEAEFAWQSLPEPVRASYGTKSAFVDAYDRQRVQQTVKPKETPKVEKPDNNVTRKGEGVQGAAVQPSTT